MKAMPSRLGALAIAVAGFAALPASAALIGGVEFPQGNVSFADAVVNFSPGLVNGGTQPTSPYLGASNALGIPNYTGANTCASQAACTFVSLGDGGSLTLRFVDNKLTGSGSNALDLWIFEIGPDVEDMAVEISKDGSLWTSVGSVGGSTSGVDIDAFGFGTGDLFEFVRLTDDTLLDGQTGATVGADIDAVGAISTVSTPPLNVPEPSALVLALAAFAGMALARRR